MPGLNGDHWFAPDQLQDPPSELVVDSTSVSDSTDSDAATVHSDDPESNLDTATTSPIPDDSTRHVDDTIIITQVNIDDFLDEPLQLQSKRSRTQVDKFTYPTTYIQSRANHKSRRSQVNSVRMVHHAFSTQYDAAVQDPIIAASISLFRKMTTGGVKSLLYGRQRELISLPTLEPPRKSMTPTGTLNEPSPAFVLMV